MVGGAGADGFDFEVEEEIGVCPHVVRVDKHLDDVLVGEETAGDVLEVGPAAAFGHVVVFGGAGRDIALEGGVAVGLDGFDALHDALDVWFG